MQVWNRFDLDGNGSLNTEEMLLVLHELGLKATINDVRALMVEFDTDNSQSIDYREFVVMLTSSMKA